MQTIPSEPRLLLQGANGKVYGVIVNRTLCKRVYGSRHILRKPPAIAIDAELYDRYRAHFDAIQVVDAETGRVYLLPAKRFDALEFPLERRFGRQYAVALRWWHTEPESPSEQLCLALEGL